MATFNEMYNSWNGKIYAGFIYVGKEKTAFTDELKDAFILISKSRQQEELILNIEQTKTRGRKPTFLFWNETGFSKSNFDATKVYPYEMSIQEMIDFCNNNQVRAIEIFNNDYSGLLREQL